MSHALLTIIIPTYNRAAHLSKLLKALRSELKELEHLVEVFVSDNASTDSTSQVTAAAAHEWRALKIQRLDRNLGPESNFLSCVSRVSTRYFWIIGDDDCPKLGVLKKIVQVLKEKTPALVYMQSEWVDPVLGPEQGEQVGELRITNLSALQFAAEVHVWVTFISGMIIDKERLISVVGDNRHISRFNSTSLIQLGWILPLLRSHGPFLFISDCCILATKNNSGGYGLLTVFGVNFTKIVNESFGSKDPLALALINGNITNYLPGRVWEARAPGPNYNIETPWQPLQEQLGSHWLYWLLLVPLGRYPKWIAFLYLQIWRVLNRLRKASRQRFYNKKMSSVRIT